MPDRITGYGVGSPKIFLAPVPFEINRVLVDNVDTQYNVGQLAWQVPTQSFRLYNGHGLWTTIGGAGGPLQTINGVAPFPANNINLINEGGAGALTITAPGSGGAGTVGLGVNVDGITIQIVGNQLVATAVSPALQLTGDIGGPQLYSANNFNFNSTATGAIEFNSSAAGQMDVRVIPDNVTIEINASNQLQEIGAASGSTTTVNAVTADIIAFPMGGSANVRTFDIMIVGFNTTTPSGLGYEIFGTVRTDGATATLVGTPDKINNEEVPSIAGDANLIVVGNNAVVRVLGVAGQTIEWRAILKSINV